MNIDALSRIINMLNCVPSYPLKTTTQAIFNQLTNLGEHTSTRTIQRDLLQLYNAGSFGLELDNRSKPYGWYRNSEWRQAVPANMPFNTAVQFMLIKQVVQKHLPESILLPLQNYFSVAETVLKQASDNKTKLNAYSGEQQKEAMLLLALVKQTKVELTLNLTIDKNNADKQVTYPNAEVWQVDYQQQAVQYYVRLSHLGTKLHWLSLNDIVNITATNQAASHDKTTLTQIEVELVCTGAIERINDYLKYHQIPVTTEIKQGSKILATFNNFQQIWQLMVFAMGKVQLISPSWVCRRVRVNLNSLSCCLS